MAKPENERERIARIIGDSFSPNLTFDLSSSATQTACYRSADAIIAQRESGEPVAWVVTDTSGLHDVYWGADGERRARKVAGSSSVYPLYDRASASQALAEPDQLTRNQAEVYREMHEIATERLGYECILTALEDLDRLKSAPAEDQARVQALEAELRVALSAYAGIIDLGGKLDLFGSNLELVESAHARVTALLSGSTPKPAAMTWLGSYSYEPTAGMIEAGLETNHRHNSEANMIASFKAMMMQAEIEEIVTFGFIAASAPVSPTRDEILATLAGFDDEYMTSEKHHPGHVLIPVDVFERVRALLSPSTPKPARVET